jgi:hypothetical protein
MVFIKDQEHRRFMRFMETNRKYAVQEVQRTHRFPENVKQKEYTEDLPGRYRNLKCKKCGAG